MDKSVLIDEQVKETIIDYYANALYDEFGKETDNYNEYKAFIYDFMIGIYDIVIKNRELYNERQLMAVTEGAMLSNFYKINEFKNKIHIRG